MVPLCVFRIALVITVAFYRLVNAAKALGVQVEDPFVLVFQDTAYSVDEPLCFLKHSIRDSYGQLLLQRSMSRRVDSAGPIGQVDVPFTRKFFLSPFSSFTQAYGSLLSYRSTRPFT